MHRIDQNPPQRLGVGRQLGAVALYAAISLSLLGRDILRNLAGYHLGPAVDSSFLMWALTWWPYALRHGINPFICRLVWAPEGFNLAWSGGIPLPSLVAAPLTTAAGPVVAYNVLCLAAPALAAWCAFLLCYRLSGGYFPALIGGYIFGFSSYLLGQLVGGHLNLMLVLPAPLIAMVVIARVKSAMTSRVAGGLLALTFVAQFLCSIELAATTVVFGAIALVISWWFADAAGRTRLRGLIAPLAGAAAVALLVLSPYLYYLFLPGVPHGAINSPGGYSADLANLLIPTRTALLGLTPAFEALARRFPGNLAERGAYLGLPLILIIAHFGVTQRRDPAARMLLVLFAIIVVGALGPRLRIVGWTGFGMPWKLAMHVPLIKSALPSRFMNYAVLVAAVIASLWLADTALPRRLRIASAIFLIAASLPNLHARLWAAPTNLPGFFTDGAFRRHLSPGENVVVLPYGIDGDSMLWQAAAGMSFRMAGGYTGITPREFERWPVVRAFVTGTYIPHMTEQLLAFMGAQGADLVIVDQAHRNFWAPVLASADPAPTEVGGVWLYRVNPTILARLRESSGLDWERCDAEARFAGEVVAAREYIFTGNDPALLSPLRAQQLGFLPPRWVKDRDVRTDNGLYLGPWPDGGIAIGVVGSYEALQPLIAKYRIHATKIFFPYPKELKTEPDGDTFLRLLVMVFQREVLHWDLPSPGVGASRLAEPPPGLCY